MEEKPNTSAQNGHSSPTSEAQLNFSVAKFTDVIFVVSGKEFKVHQNILLATKSLAFVEMFDAEANKQPEATASSANHRIEIKDIDPKVFEIMLKYIYTGKIDLLDQFATELFMVAHKVWGF